MIKLSEAKAIIDELDVKLDSHIFYGQICGSIRRKKNFVNDIDWVIVPSAESTYEFGQESFDNTITRLHDEGKILLGKKIKRFNYKGVSIDIYIATELTFQTLMLIRTGSKEHNIKLTTLARGKGLKLFADGSGLCKVDKDEKIIEVVENTEKGILNNLLGKFVEPEDRNE